MLWEKLVAIRIIHIFQILLQFKAPTIRFGCRDCLRCMFVQTRSKKEIFIVLAHRFMDLNPLVKQSSPHRNFINGKSLFRKSVSSLSTRHVLFRGMKTSRSRLELSLLSKIYSSGGYSALLFLKITDSVIPARDSVAWYKF